MQPGAAPAIERQGAVPDTLWPRDIGPVAAAVLIDTSLSTIASDGSGDTVYVRSVFAAIDPQSSASDLAKAFLSASSRVVAEVMRGFLLIHLEEIGTADEANARLRTIQQLPGVRHAVLLTSRERKRRLERPPG